MSTPISNISIQRLEQFSLHLNRTVILDVYVDLHQLKNEETSLLLINDGQDLLKMDLDVILQKMHISTSINPLLVVGIHCNENRKNEYGTAHVLDYLDRGNQSSQYQTYIVAELIPFIKRMFNINTFKQKAIAGFSLGALSAVDTALNHPGKFAVVGAFSGAFWWRDKDQFAKDFDENKNRILHQRVQKSAYQPSLRFFFEAGQLDETADRNNNGIIDSIDDTLDLIAALKQIGYHHPSEIHYLELADGKHNIATWAITMPYFLEWAFHI